METKVKPFANDDDGNDMRGGHDCDHVGAVDDGVCAVCHEKVAAGKKTCKAVTVPFTPDALVHEYEDEEGGPVWYIP